MTLDTGEDWGRKLRNLRLGVASPQDSHVPWEELSSDRQNKWIRTALRFGAWAGRRPLPEVLKGMRKRRRWLRAFLAWYDFWIGFYYDREKRILYFCPFPMVVLAFDFGRGRT